MWVILHKECKRRLTLMWVSLLLPGLIMYKLSVNISIASCYFPSFSHINRITSKMLLQLDPIHVRNAHHILQSANLIGCKGFVFYVQYCGEWVCNQLNRIVLFMSDIEMKGRIMSLELGFPNFLGFVSAAIPLHYWLIQRCMEQKDVFTVWTLPQNLWNIC